LHEAEGLPVSLRMRHAEIALEVLLGVSPLLVPDDHHRYSRKACPPADDRRVVHVEPVAMKLYEVGEDGAEVVQGIRTAGVTGHHDPLDRREISVDLLPERLELALQPLELAVDVDLALRPDPLQVFDLPLQLEQRLLELQRIRRGHRVNLP